MKLFYRFQNQLMQAGAAMRHILDDLLAHARLPKMFEMIGDARDGLFFWIGAKKERNLIGHVDHVLIFHGQSSVEALSAEMSSEICVVARRISR